MRVAGIVVDAIIYGGITAVLVLLIPGFKELVQDHAVLLLASASGISYTQGRLRGQNDEDGRRVVHRVIRRHGPARRP